MSTRAHIRIKDGRDLFLLYHHHDGYPEGIGVDLKKFLSAKNYWCGDCIANELVKSKDDDEYEITSCLHGDEEYIYVIDCNNKTLKCYKHNWDEPFDISVTREEIEIPNN